MEIQTIVLLALLGLILLVAYFAKNYHQNTLRAERNRADSNWKDVRSTQLLFLKTIKRIFANHYLSDEQLLELDCKARRYQSKAVKFDKFKIQDEINHYATNYPMIGDFDPHSELLHFDDLSSFEDTNFYDNDSKHEIESRYLDISNFITLLVLENSYSSKDIKDNDFQRSTSIDIQQLRWKINEKNYARFTKIANSAMGKLEKRRSSYDGEDFNVVYLKDEVSDASHYWINVKESNEYLYVVRSFYDDEEVILKTYDSIYHSNIYQAQLSPIDNMKSIDDYRFGC